MVGRVRMNVETPTAQAIRIARVTAPSTTRNTDTEKLAMIRPIARASYIFEIDAGSGKWIIVLLSISGSNFHHKTK